MVLQAIKYQRGALEILDQLQLPHVTKYEVIKTSKDAWEAIHSMRVRGAPAIAMVAALGLAVEVFETEPENAASYIKDKLDYLVTSRPTAVNLSRAAMDLKSSLDAASSAGSSNEQVRLVYLEAAEQMLVDDVRDNEEIGRHGADWIRKNTGAAEQGRRISVITICNTGSLATAGYGTALGVIRSLHSSSKLRRAFCLETRPYNQGSRLTAFELVHDQIPGTLITDSMAAALMTSKGREENIGAVVVGADRVAANGDSANKIGTYSLAILAKHHGIKFLVAAPRTTIDMATATGNSIKIEQRPGRELVTIRGPRITGSGLDLESGSETISIAAEGIDVWNPAFDVTPAALIDGIITEVGVVEKNSAGEFAMQAVMDIANGKS